MNRAILVLLACSLVVAGSTGVLVKRYLKSQGGQTAAHVEETGDMIEILVAAHAMSPGQVIEKGDLKWQKWPEEVAEKAGFITKPEAKRKEKAKNPAEDLVGSTLRVPMVAGEPVTESKVFMRKDAGFVAGLLDPGYRAVSVGVDATTGAGGLIMPGDRVDVLLTVTTAKLMPNPQGDPVGVPQFISETILRDLRVLAVERKIAAPEEDDEKAKAPRNVTLEVSPKQAEILATGANMGKLSLSLRSFSKVNGAVDEAAKSELAAQGQLEKEVERAGAASALASLMGSVLNRSMKAETANSAPQERAGFTSDFEVMRNFSLGFFNPAKTPAHAPSSEAAMPAAEQPFPMPKKAEPVKVLVFRGDKKEEMVFGEDAGAAAEPPPSDPRAGGTN